MNDTWMKIGDAELAVDLGAKPGPAEKRAAELLAERIKDRAGITLAGPGTRAAFRLAIGTAGGRTDVAAPGPGGYGLTADPQTREIRVIGDDADGVVAGVGRLLREMRYHPGRVELPRLAIAEAPRMPNRGMYLWARKHFFGQPDQVDRYIEELALWGCNGICFWFEMGMFNSFDDASVQNPNDGYQNHMNSVPPQDWVKMYRRFYATARRLGMKTGLIMAVNDAYRTSPPDLRIQPIIGCPDWYLCPSKPGAVEKMIAWQEQVFKSLQPIDIFNIFPADAGGCSCKDCTPWPTRGLWRMAKPLAERIHEISPTTQIWVDTWHLNHPTFGGKDWKNLVANLDRNKERPEWFAGFEVGLAPKHPFAALSAEDRRYYSEAKRPLMVFPDISMWGNHKGMLVNKDYWKLLQAELNDYAPGLMKGGWPYSERWNTDIASVMFLSWFWNPEKPVETVLDEYAAFTFGPGAAPGRRLLDLLDDGYPATGRAEALRAAHAALEKSLPAWVTRDWRWREITEAVQFRIASGP